MSIIPTNKDIAISAACAPLLEQIGSLAERIQEREAALATSKANNQKYCITIAELEAERDRLLETIEILKQVIDHGKVDKAVF